MTFPSEQIIAGALAHVVEQQRATGARFVRLSCATDVDTSELRTLFPCVRVEVLSLLAPGCVIGVVG